MKSLLKHLPLTVLAVVLSCQKPDPVQPKPDSEDPVDKYEATITLTDATVTLGAEEGSTASLVFACDHKWTLEIPEDAASWLSAEKTSGKSGKTIRLPFVAKANTGPQRSVTCRIISGSKKKKFTVTQAAAVLTLKASEVQDIDKYYKPLEFNFDMLRSDSKWSWCRSKQSEHFVVFWDIQYGQYGLYADRMGEEMTWPSNCKSDKMRVDIDDLLAKAEEFYDLNVNKLKFADTGKGKSVLDKYKMEIYLIWQDDWLATGSGYDNTIGALWVNPSTCQPVGSTIGHEIGHCFQYMTFCDYLVREGKGGSAAPSANTNQGPGWRYGFGANGAGGNGFWEQTAQWQSLQLEKYRPEAFGGWFGDFPKSMYLHVLHERPRYANYFIHWWWVEQNDITFIGRMWNEAMYPEDPVETYMRLMGYDVAAMNDSMWEYAAHMLTFDTEEIRSYGKSSIGKTALPASNVKADGDWWTVTAKLSPETTGSNAIQMTAAAGKEVSATLSANLGISGCVSGSVTIAGWRYGFVSYNKDGTTSYSPVWRETDKAQSWTVPSNSSKLWFVVTGAPTRYERHPWTDETDDKDTKWPWKAKFDETKPYGK
jgi:hypothetical protein